MTSMFCSFITHAVIDQIEVESFISHAKMQYENSFGNVEVTSLNYIKQLGLQDSLRLQCRFMMDTLRSHKYDTPLARVVYRGGPHVFGFLIKAFCLEMRPQT